MTSAVDSPATQVAPRGAEGDDDLFYLSAGPLAAILLGMGLVPLRGFTVASNFTFVFVVLTIVVAELGGRRAALATAVVSTLSLDFFLTEPYLKLTIASKHDVYALAGLAVCGAVSAKLASSRGERQQVLRVSRAHLALLHAGVRQLVEPGANSANLLDALRGLAPFSAVTLRDAWGRLLASSGDADDRPVPLETWQVHVLLDDPAGSQQPLSPHGIRIVLRAEGRDVGSLDVWGSGTPLTAGVRTLLGELAALLSVHLARATEKSK